MAARVKAKPPFEPEREYDVVFNRVVTIAGSPVPAWNRIRVVGEYLIANDDAVADAEPV